MCHGSKTGTNIPVLVEVLQRNKTNRINHVYYIISLYNYLYNIITYYIWGIY